MTTVAIRNGRKFTFNPTPNFFFTLTGEFKTNSVDPNFLPTYRIKKEIVAVSAHRIVAVGAHRLVAVGAHRFVAVGAHRMVAVGAHRFVAVGAHRFVAVGAHRFVAVGAHRLVAVDASLDVGWGRLVSLA